MVSGLKDSRFGVDWAEWLEQNLPGLRGVRKVQDGNPFSRKKCRKP